MGAIDCLIISIMSVGWGAFLFALGRAIKEHFDALGFSIQILGTIFIAAPLVTGILALSTGIMICMFHVVQATFNAII